MTYDPRRDDLLFQSAKADGKGWFELPNMRDLAPRGWPPAPPEPMVRKPAGPDPRDALAELCEALEKLTKEARRVQNMGAQAGPHWVPFGIAIINAAAALRRARGLA